MIRKTWKDKTILYDTEEVEENYNSNNVAVIYAKIIICFTFNMKRVREIEETKNEGENQMREWLEQ